MQTMIENQAYLHVMKDFEGWFPLGVVFPEEGLSLKVKDAEVIIEKKEPFSAEDDELYMYEPISQDTARELRSAIENQDERGLESAVINSGLSDMNHFYKLRNSQIRFLSERPRIKPKHFLYFARSIAEMFKEEYPHAEHIFLDGSFMRDSRDGGNVRNKVGALFGDVRVPAQAYDGLVNADPSHLSNLKRAERSASALTANYDGLLVGNLPFDGDLIKRFRRSLSSYTTHTKNLHWRPNGNDFKLILRDSQNEDVLGGVSYSHDMNHSMGVWFRTRSNLAEDVVRRFAGASFGKGFSALREGEAQIYNF